MKKRKVTPELVEELRRVQQNAWGNVTLDDIAVDCVFSNGKRVVLELQIEPEIILKGQANYLTPGVVYRPEYYGVPVFDDLPDIGEIVAYAINEGKVTKDTITKLEETDLSVRWQVRAESIRILEVWGII
jgi:hypothetical protein